MGHRGPDASLGGGPAGSPASGVRIPFGTATATGRREHGDDGGDLLGRRVAADDPQRRALAAFAVTGRLVSAHSGMFPCFLGGSVWRLLRSARSARTTFIRVFDGEITVSMYPRSAATYGFASSSS